MKSIFPSAILVGAIAATSPVDVEARDCRPGTPGYVSGFFSDACVLTLTSPTLSLQMQATYTKARINDGINTGDLKTPGVSGTIQAVHEQVQLNLNKAIDSIGGSRVQGYLPTVNLGGKVIVNASPDVNIGKNLRRNTGEGSPAFALYEATPESMLTAQRRCNDLLESLPTQAQIGGQKFRVTTNGLICVPQVKPLDISAWAGPLTKLALELKNTGLAPNDMDDAQILGIKYANNPTTIPTSLSKESQDTIKKLTQELDAIRTTEINGTMQASVMVNKQEYNIGNIIGSLTGLAAIIALILWFQKRNSPRRDTVTYAH